MCVRERAESLSIDTSTPGKCCISVRGTNNKDWATHFFFLGREEAVTVSTRKLDDCDLNKAAIGTDYLQHMTATIRKMIRRAPVSDGSV